MEPFPLGSSLGSVSEGRVEKGQRYSLSLSLPTPVLRFELRKCQESLLAGYPRSCLNPPKCPQTDGTYLMWGNSTILFYAWKLC